MTIVPFNTLNKRFHTFSSDINSRENELAQVERRFAMISQSFILATNIIQ